MHEQNPRQDASTPAEPETQTDSGPQPEKQPYQRPTLHCYGSVPRITLGRGGSGSDAGSNPSQRRPRNIVSINDLGPFG